MYGDANFLESDHFEYTVLLYRGVGAGTAGPVNAAPIFTAQKRKKEKKVGLRKKNGKK